MISGADDISRLIEDVEYRFLASDVFEDWRAFRARYHTRIYSVYGPGGPFLR